MIQIVYKIAVTIGLFVAILFAKPSSAHTSDSGKVTQEYTLESFSKVRLQGGYTLHIKQGEREHLSITTSPNIIDRFKVEVQDDELRVWIPNDKYFDTSAYLELTIQDITQLKIEGGIKATTDGYIQLENIDILVEGGAIIDLMLTAENINFEGSGGITATLKGITNNLDILLQGAGLVYTKQLKAEDVKCSIEGVGIARIHASKTLDATLEGVGGIHYTGDPMVTKRVDGLGFIKPD